MGLCPCTKRDLAKWPTSTTPRLFSVVAELTTLISFKSFSLRLRAIILWSCIKISTSTWSDRHQDKENGSRSFRGVPIHPCHGGSIFVIFLGCLPGCHWAILRPLTIWMMKQKAAWWLFWNFNTTKKSLSRSDHLSGYFFLMNYKSIKHIKEMCIFGQACTYSVSWARFLFIKVFTALFIFKFIVAPKHEITWSKQIWKLKLVRVQIIMSNIQIPE